MCRTISKGKILVFTINTYLINRKKDQILSVLQNWKNEKMSAIR